MKRFVHCVTAGLALGFAACSRSSVPPLANEEFRPKYDISHFQALNAATEAHVINTNRIGRPTHIEGGLGKATLPPLGLTAASVHDSIRPALPGVAALFDLRAEDLTVRRITQDEAGNMHVHYAQTKSGLEVVGGELIVHVTPTGRIFAANGSAFDGVSLTSIPKISADTVKLLAIQGSRDIADAKASDPQLVYFRADADSDLKLAYETMVTGNRADMPARDRTFVDALDGSILAAWPTIHSTKIRELHNLNHGTTLPGPIARIEGQASINEDDVDQNYDHLGRVYDAYYNLFGRDSYNNAGATMISSVHYSTNYVNAYWNGTQTVYGDGDGVLASSLARSLDVVGHELTHAVTANESNLTYSGESGGMNEAMSDIFGNVCQWYADGQVISADTWKVGEDIWTPGTTGDALRYMDDPRLDGSSIDYYTDYYSGLDVHYSSGLANLAFKLLVTGGTHPRGRSTINVTGIGMSMAARIFYVANRDYLTASSNFADVKTKTKLAAAALGYSAAVQQSVEDAWSAVGVGIAPPAPTIMPLTNNVPVTGISGSTGSETLYALVVPSGQTNLLFNISGGTGDADLYVKRGAVPTTTTYDCRPYVGGNTENCTFTNPAADTWYVMVKAYSTYSGVQLLGRYSDGTGGDTPLVNGVESSIYSGASSAWKCFYLDVPAGRTSLIFNQIGKTGTTGDADLYVRFNAKPTTSAYNCRPYMVGSTETCSLTDPSSGRWYACSYGYSAYTGVAMKGSY